MPKQQSSLGFTIYVIGEQIRCQMHRLSLVKDRRYHLRKYKRCFVAKDVVDWAVRSHHAHTREEAVAAMSCLQQQGMIHHVVDEHDFKDQNLFFRFTRDDDTHLSNADLAVFYRGLDAYNRAKEAGIPRSFYHRGHLYEGAFYGTDLVDCLVENDSTDRQQIVSLCRELLEYGILGHVTDDYHFSDDRLMYQFRVDFEIPSLLMDVLTPPIGQQTLKCEGNRSVQSNRGAPVLTSVESEGSSVDDPSYTNPLSVSGDHKGRLQSKVLHADVKNYSRRTRGLSEITYSTPGPHEEGRKIVKMEQDQVGFGFVLRGSAPCYVHTIDPWGPAAAAGLQVGQLVLFVGNHNVMQRDHRYVGQMITSHQGVLTLVVKGTQNPDR